MPKLSDNTRKALNKCRDNIFVTQNYDQAVKDISNLLATAQDEEINFIKFHLGTVYFENLEFEKAKTIFVTLDEKYQAGYCELFQGNIEEARVYWEEAPDSGPVNWARCLPDLLNLDVTQIPTFLQIRNHLESDLSYLIKSNNLNLANNLIECSQVFITINLETYKYIGRALLNNNYPHLGLKYLLEGQETLPQDPEIYFHLAQYSIMANQLAECRHLLKKCLNINKYYTPAKKLLQICEQRLKNA